MPSMSGHGVLVSVEGLQNLAQYFHLTTQFNASNDYIPFELKGATCVSIMVCKMIIETVFCQIIWKVLVQLNLKVGKMCLGSIDLLKQKSIISGRKFKDKMNLLKKKKPGLKN